MIGPVLPLEVGAIPMSELRRMYRYSESGLRKALRRRGIVADGHLVALSELRKHWRQAYESILILYEGPQPACPRCSAPTHVACVACDFTYAGKRPKHHDAA